MIDLTTTFCNLRLENPLVLASGVRGNNADLLIRAAKEGAGAVTSKSCSLNAREGHKNPTCVSDGFYTINAIGLSNPGIEMEVEEIKKAIKETKVPIIASVYENTVQGFVQVASKMAEAKPHMIELDISCPNVHKEGQMFSSTCESSAEVIKAVKEHVQDIPISLKLSANVPSIGSISKACQDAGADCISAINTLPAMLIDIHARRPILANRYGGLSGRCIFPVALRSINEIRNSCQLPIIGGGGVSSGEDAIKMLMAGATAVSIGTAIYNDSNAFENIKSEMIEIMQKEDFSRLSDIKFIE
jgi:dihydroorotate dehydrogenase (NAD+) catalytic subunit